MGRKRKAAAQQADDEGLATLLLGEAVAVGENTYTSVDATLRLADRLKVDLAFGRIEATAAAQGSDGGLFSDAITDFAVSGVDILIARTRTVTYSDGDSTYTRSVTGFIAIDIEGINLGQLALYVTRDRAARHDPVLDLAGNRATVEFVATAESENSFVNAEVLALTVEDQLSQSTVLLEGGSMRPVCFRLLFPALR